MKYLKFDWEQLLRDYHLNKYSVQTLKDQIKVLEREKSNPYIELKEDVERNLAVCRYKLIEYEAYVDMVNRGFDVIEEDERKALILFYIKGKNLKGISEEMFRSESTCRRILKDAQKKFKEVVFPE